ncbi:hypothetical protein UNSWDHB_1488 [Dehalobacter sp. UNSWDHB]|nr:hypothetical protein DHBDCA_p2136 [Dehalobacter sp. DCA]EQB21100.1 hypothetical protein UNSWDHB_1488 [Dehalobacter sp. UNSWDHB]
MVQKNAKCFLNHLRAAKADDDQVFFKWDDGFREFFKGKGVTPWKVY